VSEKFTKREFVLTDNHPQYPQSINFQLSQGRCDIIDPYKVGETLTVTFNLRGRKHRKTDGTERVYNTLDAWKIQRFGEQAAPATPAAPAPDAGEPFPG
jgi:hypothetical protein